MKKMTIGKMRAVLNAIDRNLDHLPVKLACECEGSAPTILQDWPELEDSRISIVCEPDENETPLHMCVEAG